MASYSLGGGSSEQHSHFGGGHPRQVPRERQNSFDAGLGNDRTKLIALCRVHLREFGFQNRRIRRGWRSFDEIIELRDMHPNVAMGAREGFVNLGNGGMRMADVFAFVPLVRPEADKALDVRRGHVHECYVDV